MNAIQKRFGRPRVLLPVIHCIDPDQAFTNARCALEHGADGVFFINQGGMTAQGVVGLVQRIPVLAHSPPLFTGVNLLGVPARLAMALPWQGLGALWIDSLGIEAPNREEEARLTSALQEKPSSEWGPVLHEIHLKGRGREEAKMQLLRDARLKAWGGLLFGGVAFKYAPAVIPADYKFVAMVAAGVADVVTTSGPATGVPPELDKIERMRAAIGDHALAIASGITPENVAPFLPHVNAFLVATGIETRFGWFDPARVRALADIIHSSQPENATP
jgi:hypothetical protein